jgi:hypothetical protein
MPDVIRLTLPARPSFADVAAETAATAALRMGFGGAEVDRLRRDVTDAFRASTAEPSETTVGEPSESGVAAGPRPETILVELEVDAEEVAVRVAGELGAEVHLHRRHDAATFDG